MVYYFIWEILEIQDLWKIAHFGRLRWAAARAAS